MKKDYMVKGANGWYYLGKYGVMVTNKTFTVSSDVVIGTEVKENK